MKQLPALVTLVGTFVTALAMAPSATRAQQTYHFTDLGTLGGTFSVANDLNNLGQIVGHSFTAQGRIRAFRTAPGMPINPATDQLGHAGGVPQDSYAEGINDLGVVVGSGWTASGFHGLFTPSNGAFTASSDMGTFGGFNSIAFAVNNRGQVTGYANVNSNNPSHPFRTASPRALNAATDDLGTLGGSIAAGEDINELGQVVGGSTTPTNATSFQAFRTAPNAPINAPTDVLGTLGGTYSYARAINESGSVVGYAATAGDAAIHAFRTLPNAGLTVASDLGTLGGLQSEAEDINDFDVVVGWSDVAGATGEHAFVYVDGPGMLDLNLLVAPGELPLGWTLRRAHAINNDGWIVGEATGPGFAARAYLLRPIPEPAAGAGTVAVTWFWLASRRRRAVRRTGGGDSPACAKCAARG